MFESPTPPVSPVSPPVVKAKASSSLGTGILALAAIVAIGGVAFAAGRLTAPAAAASTTTGAGTGAGRFFGNGGTGAGNGTGTGAGFAGRLGGANGGLTLSGTVTAISSTSITLQLASGTSVTIPIDSSTTYHSQQSATSADVTAGKSVLVEVSGFGGRGAGDGAGGATGAAPGAAGSFAPPSFNPEQSPGASRVPGQFTIGPARDITIAAQ